MESLKQYVYVSGAFNWSIIIAVIDLDDFKLVNDTYGHIKGDQVLITLADVLKRNLPKNANAFRYGGEEFVLLFTKHQLNKVVEIVEAMRLEFSQCTFDFFEDTRNITFSGGIAEYTDISWSTSEFFEKADQALYLAKGEGKNQIRVFLPSIKQQ
jgi:diguanylate cyclase (GGDEF)-like protein